MLNEEEEQLFEEWLPEMATIGYGQSRRELKLAVKKILDVFKDNLSGTKLVTIKDGNQTC